MATKRSTWQEWARRVAAWRASGESAATFAARHGWNAHTLRWWANHGRTAKGPANADVGFVEVAVAPKLASRVGVIDVLLRNGRRIRVRGGADLEALSALVRALEA